MLNSNTTIKLKKALIRVSLFSIIPKYRSYSPYYGPMLISINKAVDAQVHATRHL